MSNLAIKEVEFNGNTLMACQDKETEKIYVAVKWICDGIGLSEGQTKSERKKVQEDLVLKQGRRNFVLPTKGGEQEVLCIELKFLPLWLAKISITPKMQSENPFLVAKLIEYQLKVVDVLADAFIENNHLSSNLVFLQGILDGMKENELRVKKLEEEASITNNKVIHLETEFNNESVTEGYRNGANIARKLGVYSIKDKPHSGFIDGIAKHLSIHSSKIGYKDEYVNVVRTNKFGQQTGVEVYYSDKSVEMFEKFLNEEFNPQAEYYKRGDKKGQFRTSTIELNGGNHNFNKNTYEKYKKE